MSLFLIFERIFADFIFHFLQVFGIFPKYVIFFSCSWIKQL